MDNTYSAKEAAKRLGVTPQTIASWIRQGQFPSAFKLNPDARTSAYRIPENDIIAFEKKRQRNMGQD